MTSPAINGQKDNNKTDSTSGSEDVNTSARAEVPTERSTAPLIAWWRIFKLANLLMQQGC